MKIKGVLSLMLVLPIATANRKPQKGRATYGFTGMPLGVEKEGKTDFRDILKPAASRLPSYFFEKTKVGGVGPAQAGQIKLVQPTDEELEVLGKDIQMAATQVRMEGPTEGEEDDEADEIEQEVEKDAVAKVEPPKEVKTEEFSSTDDEQGQEEEAPKQGGPALFSETDSLLMGSGQVQDQRESESASEAEAQTIFPQGGVGSGLGGGEKFVMYEKPKVLSPLEKPLGPGKKGRRNRDRRQQQQQQQQQQRTGRARRGRQFLFKGSLGEFHKWSDEQKKGSKPRGF